jgi:hypothetical protein
MCALFESLPGCRVCGAGSAFNSTLKKHLEEHFNMWMAVAVGEDAIMKSIKAGYPAIISGRGYNGLNILGNKATRAIYAHGHFICLTGIDSEDRIRVNDPGLPADAASASKPNWGPITHFPANKKIGNCTTLSQTIVIWPKGLAKPF